MSWRQVQFVERWHVGEVGVGAGYVADVVSEDPPDAAGRRIQVRLPWPYEAGRFISMWVPQEVLVAA